ncbi:MAG: DUF664 domain-containing protein [Propionicimonas sp.]
MQPTDVYLDSLERVHELVPAVLDGLSSEDIAWRPDADANPIGWLIWHLLRAWDDHVAEIGGREQVWLADGWEQRFSLPYDRAAVGFGMTSEQVGQFWLDDPSVLVGYADAVWAMSREVLRGLDQEGLARIIDTRWDPPVTVAARLVSVVIEVAQHIGQASYLRGLRERVLGTDSGWKGYPA